MMEALVPHRKSRRTPWNYARAAVVAVLALAVPLTMASCASERPPRSFVQPNVLKKSDLEGTFYYLQTVVDAPPTNGAMFKGLSSDLLKIKFDVQENFIYAVRAFEHIENSEDEAEANRLGYKGQPLAAWRISHFDIIRDYNSTTGEQTNRVIESMERPWYQREFIRVDWSMNLVTDFNGLGLSMFFDNLRAQGVSYWESDPSKPDGIHIEHVKAEDKANKEGLKTGELAYLDVTNQMIVDPSMNEIPGYGTFPQCFFYYDQEDCASQLVKVRHAFVKVAPEHKYEPLKWDGKKMKLFGQWDVGLRRLSYNREYGVTNSGFIRHAARFNIWTQDSYDENGNLKGPDEVTPNTIPYYASGSRAIKYQNHDRFPDGFDYVYPEELYEDFKRIVGEWNDGMKTAAALYKKIDLNDEEAMKKLPNVFVPCHNPVDYDADDEACWKDLPEDLNADGTVAKDKQGRAIRHARQGDPRRSNIYWVNEQQNAGPLGYGPGKYDPQTGETISGQAYIYGAAIETYATRSRDMVMLLNGDITTDDFVAGQNVKDWVAANKFGKGPGESKVGLISTQMDKRAATSHGRSLSDREVSAMAGAMNFKWARGMDANSTKLDVTSPQALKASLQMRDDDMYKNYWGRLAGDRDARMSKLTNTEFEQMMITPERLSAVGISPARSVESLTGAEMLMASPLRAKALEEATAKYRMKAEMLGVDFATFDDNGMNQTLRRYLQKYGVDSFLEDDGTIGARAEQLRLDLLHEIYIGVTLHEMGHNVGCRHNFRASFDSMNYFEGYWEARVGALTHPDQGMPAGDGKLHARYVNKAGGRITQYEMDRQIQEYQYASIMDYGNEFYSDLRGLGLYDKAILKFSYAGYVEVFTDTKSDAATLDKLQSIHTFYDAYGFPSPLGTGSGLTAINYTSYPDLFKSGYKGIYKRKNVPYSDIDQANGRFIDQDGNPLVPYYFCSDEFVGNLTCQRFDSGADAYEQATDIISRYKNFYLLNNFKRDRQSFHSSQSYAARIGGRYFDMLRDQLTWYTLLRADFTDYMADVATNQSNVERDTNKFFVDETNGWGNFTAGVALGYELIGSTITQPEPGWYVKEDQPDGTQMWVQKRDDVTDPGITGVNVIGLLDGKYIDNTWDFDGCGYYWAEECQTRIGYMVDKQVALDFLSQSQAYFTGRDTSVDVRRYAIGYVIPFKDQIQEKIGALLAEDAKSIAPTFVKVGTENGKDIFAPRTSSWLMPEDTSTKTDLIDSATGFTMALYSGIYALAAFPTTFDASFIDNTRIFVLGNGESSATESEIAANGTSEPSDLVTYGGSKTWLTVADPISGKTFAARASTQRGIPVLDPRVTNPDPSNNYGITSVPVRADSGVRMLEKLKVLADKAASLSGLPDTDSRKSFANNELQKFRQNIEVMRSLHNAYGFTPFRAD
jgi:hypothetical protein